MHIHIYMHMYSVPEVACLLEDTPYHGRCWSKRKFRYEMAQFGSGSVPFGLARFCSFFSVFYYSIWSLRSDSERFGFLVFVYYIVIALAPRCLTY